MTDVQEASDARRAQLAEALDGVEQRILNACNASGRPRRDLTLVVVTKTFPASDVRLLAGMGVRDVGESRDQEAAPKVELLADLDLRWHFVGRLQSNKARSVGSYASAVHSVDRPSLVAALEAAATAAGREVGVLVQVSLDGDPARGGVPVDLGAGPDRPDRLAGLDGLEALRELTSAVSDSSALVLRGVMAVAPLGQDPAPAFDRLAEVAAAVRREHPAAAWISAGMSGDLEAAVAAGATHLRVGSAILGSRPSLR